MANRKPEQSSRTAAKKVLFLFDDVWRIEKLDLFRHLKGRVDFDLATHDDETYEQLRDVYRVHKLPVIKLKRNLRYYTAFLFARDLDTNNIRYRKNIRLRTGPRFRRVLLFLRELLGRLPVPRYTLSDALDFLYRGSHQYDEVLKEYDVLVVCPVHNHDHRIIYEALQKGVRVLFWIYSWDHPVKDNEFLAGADRYFVWSKFTARDLKRLHGIPREKVTIVGGVQFDYPLERAGRPRRRKGPRYVLVVCTGAIKEHIEQEIVIIRRTRAMMNEIDPGIEVWVRPYPYRHTEKPYGRLKGLKGIRLLDIGESTKSKILMSREDLDNKLDQVWNAECLVNFCSTLGLETSFSSTPILQMNFNFPTDLPWYLNLREYHKNDHVKQYLLDHDLPNVVSSEEEMKERLRDILAGNREPYMEYSRRLQLLANPLKVSSYKEVFAEKLAAYVSRSEDRPRAGRSEF